MSQLINIAVNCHYWLLLSYSRQTQSKAQSYCDIVVLRQLMRTEPDAQNIANERNLSTNHVHFLKNK